MSKFTSSGKARGMVAGFVASVLLCLVVATAVIACPMLTAAAKAAHPCCAKYSHTSGKKCPAGPSEETCPLILSDSKLGVTKHKLEIGTPGVLTAPVLVAAAAWTAQALPVAESTPVAQSLYLLHRVLRN